jgi:hypothetical protein
MQNQQGARRIRAIRDNLLSFKGHLDVPTALIVCMGDTLTHLPDLQSIESLFGDVAEALEPGGTFIATFRDYSTPLVGLRRFIPVRSDSDRILMCFLEYDDVFVTVYDILHERAGTEWQQRSSAYRKLRLSPDWVMHALAAEGLKVRAEEGIAGMVRLVAKKPL